MGHRALRQAMTGCLDNTFNMPRVHCYISLSQQSWQKGHIGLHQPALELGRESHVSVYDFILEASNGSRIIAWRLNEFTHAKRINEPAMQAKCCCCLSILVRNSMPALVGFVAWTKQGQLRAAAPATDVETVNRLHLLHAWVCHAVEVFAEDAGGIASFSDAGFAPVEVEWPVGTRDEALRHIAAACYGVHIMDVSSTMSFTKFGGTECPICLEPWEVRPQGTLAVSLPCGHSCCEAC